jgi:hypothetical protein
VMTIPVQKRATKTAVIYWRDQDLPQTFNAQRSTSNAKCRRLLNVER